MDEAARRPARPAQGDERALARGRAAPRRQRPRSPTRPPGPGIPRPDAGVQPDFHKLVSSVSLPAARTPCHSQLVGAESKKKPLGVESKMVRASEKCIAEVGATNQPTASR